MSAFTPGSDHLGWTLSDAVTHGPAPRYEATKGEQRGWVQVFPFKGFAGTHHQSLAEGVRRWKDLPRSGFVPVDVELRDRAVVIAAPELSGVSEGQQLTDKEACAVLGELCVPLGVLHAKGLAHGELEIDSIARVDGKHLLKPPSLRVPPAAVRRLLLKVDPRYAAPEVLDGQEPKPHSDMFSLGLILYRLISGQHPVDAAEPAQVFAARGAQTAPDLPQSASAGVKGLYAKLTALRPEQRPQDAAELQRDLEALLEKGKAPALNPLPSAEFQPARVGGSLLAFFVLAALVGGMVALAIQLQPRSPTQGYAYVLDEDAFKEPTPTPPAPPQDGGAAPLDSGSSAPATSATPSPTAAPSPPPPAATPSPTVAPTPPPAATPLATPEGH